MIVEFSDKKVEKVRLGDLSIGDTFLDGDRVGVHIGFSDNEHNEADVLILFGETRYIDTVDSDYLVQKVNSKLVVEI